MCCTSLGMDCKLQSSFTTVFQILSQQMCTSWCRTHQYILYAQNLETINTQNQMSWLLEICTWLGITVHISTHFYSYPLTVYSLVYTVAQPSMKMTALHTNKTSILFEDNEKCMYKLCDSTDSNPLQVLGDSRIKIWKGWYHSTPCHTKTDYSN